MPAGNSKLTVWGIRIIIIIHVLIDNTTHGSELQGQEEAGCT